MSKPDSPQEPVIIRDNRKIDPTTGEARKPASAEGQPSADEPAADAAVDESVALLAERTADLQRVQAEYANYRKRADRERLAAGEVAVSGVLATLLPVLDNIDRAREHGDLTGGLKAVADQLHEIVTRLGLEAFGEIGDPFDPSVHEAVMHNEGDDVSEPTATTVMRKGYKHGERLLRPAMVGVTDPSSPPAEAGSTTPTEPDDVPQRDAEPHESDS